MSYTVEKIMEKVGSDSPGLTIEYIQEAIRQIETDSERSLKTYTQSIVCEQRNYLLPSNYDAIKRVAVKNDDGEYIKIGRIVGELGEMENSDT